MKKPLFTCIFSVLLAAFFLLGSCTSNPGTSDEAREKYLKPVPSDSNFHVYIAFGQSNMQGPGGVEAQDKEGVSDRFQVLNVLRGTYNKEKRAPGQWYKAVPPLIIPDSESINWKGLPVGLSPVDYFGRTLTENTPDEIKIGVIAVASGDMGLAAFAKDNKYVMRYFNTTASSTAKQGMEKYRYNMYGRIIEMARIAQKDGVIKGIIVHQGESGVNNSNGEGWGGLLKSIYNDMLLDLDLEPNSIPILVGQTFNGGSGRTGGDLNNINEYIPNAYVISSVGCEGRLEPDGKSIDNIHFGSAGLRELGRRYGKKMLELNY
jgi:hypothetical protein